MVHAGTKHGTLRYKTRYRQVITLPWSYCPRNTVYLGTNIMILCSHKMVSDVVDGRMNSCN